MGRTRSQPLEHGIAGVEAMRAQSLPRLLLCLDQTGKWGPCSGGAMGVGLSRRVPLARHVLMHGGPHRFWVEWKDWGTLDSINNLAGTLSFLCMCGLVLTARESFRRKSYEVWGTRSEVRGEGRGDRDG